MLRTILAAAAVACAITVPASAQNSGSGGMNSGNAMSSGSDASSMSCGQMMAREQSMSSNATGARMTMAQNHMHLASVAQQKGDDAGCKMHVQKAMDVLR